MRFFFRFMALVSGNSTANVMCMGEEEADGVVNNWVAITDNAQDIGFVP